MLIRQPQKLYKIITLAAVHYLAVYNHLIFQS
jgi:hypothetical protein